MGRRGYRFLGEIEVVDASSSDFGDSPNAGAGTTAPIAPPNLLGDIEGKNISHYLVLDKLGSGGMGVVFRGKDLNLNRNVALKFLPEEYSQHPEPLERFRQEARTAAAHQSPEHLHHLRNRRASKPAFYRHETSGRADAERSSLGGR